MVTSKITLPLLKTLRLNNTQQFTYFSMLVSLQNIHLACWDQLIDFDGIFDPSAILDLEIGDINSFEVFPINLFPNLKSLKSIIVCFDPQKLEFLTQMKALKNLSLKVIVFKRINRS